MKKQCAFLLLVLVGMAGCRKKDKQTHRKSKHKTEVFSEVDIPVANEVIHNLLDEDVNEFKVIDDSSDDKVAANDFDSLDDFKWVEDVTQEDGAFKIVYFDFDKYSVREDQEATLAHNITLAKRIIDEAKIFGDDSSLPTIVIEGHACHSAGNRIYNLALSEKRAKVLADRLIAAGIARECIKIVGMGMEVPAILNGKPVDGDREQQWANRRDVLRILYA